MTELDVERQAQQLREKWGERLDRFVLPCPLCRGTLQFHGVSHERLFEFAEGEPDVVTPLAVHAFTFICNRCGYSADFDAGLFNPGYLAQLQGASPERVAALSIRDYQVLVPLSGEEKSQTLLTLASALAGIHHGEVLALHVAAGAEQEERASARLSTRLQRYVPAPGDPAPVRLLFRRADDIGDAIVATAADERVELLLVGWRGWTYGRGALMGSVLDTVLSKALCDVAVLHDRGLASVRRILLPTAGGPHARVGARLAYELAQAFAAELHLLYVAAPDLRHAEQAGHAHFAATLRDLGASPDDEPGSPADTLAVDVARHVVTGADVARTIVDEAAGYDLLVVGASPRKRLGRMRRGDLALKIARNCNPTSLVVSARNSLLGAWLNRLFL